MKKEVAMLKRFGMSLAIRMFISAMGAVTLLPAAVFLDWKRFRNKKEK